MTNSLPQTLSLSQWHEFLPTNFPELLSVWAAKAGVAILVFLGFLLVSLIIKRIIISLGGRSDPQKEEIVALIGQIARIALIVFGFVTAAGTMGINVSALVAGLGLTGFALGFAFRDALSNVLAGIMILFYRPFRRGDRVSVTGLEGQVKRIDLRYTTIENETKTFLIPNSILLTTPIIISKSAAPSPATAPS